MKNEKNRRIWLRLDNAAKIFPASMRPAWSNVFRVSVSFREPIDPDALARATVRAAKRFPSICVRLGTGFFWYYLEESGHVLKPRKEKCHPLFPMRKREIKKLALRVLYYENRLAVEFFHALTDGSGAMVFLKTLAAIYLQERYGVSCYDGEGILFPEDEPDAEELEDAFLRYAGPTAAKREMPYAFHLTGVPESDGFLHVTRGTVSCKEILSAAKEKGVSLTTYLAAAFCYCLENIQKSRCAPHKEKAVRVQIPVNLRKHFPSRTLRNFVAVYNVGVEKGETDADFDELLSRIHHQMALFNTPRNLRAVFTANVNSEKGVAIRLVPLFLKNIVMRAVFDRVGESLACLCLSNLGAVKLPEQMSEYVTGFDFIIGPQAKAPYNCGVVSYGDDLHIHLVRNTVHPELERAFFSFLSSQGIAVTLESNER